MGRADSRHPQGAPAGGEHRCAADVDLSAGELDELERAAAKLEIQGGRYAEAAERMTNL